MSLSTARHTVSTIANESKSASESLRGRSFKKCAACGVQANSNAEKSCHDCGHVYTSNSSVTRQGRSFKKCSSCGTEANSNRQTVCKNAACGKKFVFKSGSAEKTSGKRKRDSNNRVQKKRRLGSNIELGNGDDNFDDFMAMLNSCMDPVPEAPIVVSAPKPQPDFLESFDSILEEVLSERAVEEVEEWERQLLDEMNVEWLDQQALPTAPLAVTSTPGIMV